MPKIIAIRSITNVDEINRFAVTKAKPSLTAAQPAAESGSCSGGIGRIRKAARNSAPYVTRSSPYARAKPNRTISTPATAGPTMFTVCQRTWFRVSADGISSVPTSRGVIAERAGSSIAPTNAVIAFAP